MLVGILVIELIFGGWIGRNYGTLVLPIDYERRFDVSKLYDWPGNYTNYSRDSYGLRGEYNSPAKINIITMGGSTTNEIFISEGHTWSDILASNFQKSGRDITIVNAGVDGQSTIGHLKNFEVWFPKIPKFSAQYILVYLGINDLALIKANYNQNKQDGLFARRNVIKQYIMNNSAIYTLFRNVRGMVIARNANLIHTGKNFNNVTWELAHSINVKSFEERYSPDLLYYVMRLMDLAKSIHNFGAEPIFVTQSKGSYRIKGGKIYVPAGESGRVSLDEYAGLSAINKVTIKVCREIKAICIDLAKNLEFKNGDHYDRLHTTPGGSEKIGLYLFKTLRNKLIFEN